VNDVALTASVGSGFYDPAAFTASLPLPPANFNLNFNDGIWLTAGGGLSAPFSQTFSVTGGKATAFLPNPQTASVKLDVNNGIVTGSFQDADLSSAKRKVTFQSLILTQGGAPTLRGYYVMPNTAKAPGFYVGGDVTGY
jgi:hypothetical protein